MFPVRLFNSSNCFEEDFVQTDKSSNKANALSSSDVWKNKGRFLEDLDVKAHPCSEALTFSRFGAPVEKMPIIAV